MASMAAASFQLGTCGVWRVPARYVVALTAPCRRCSAGRAAYAERKWLSEAPNGWITHVLGFRRFSLRGLAKVQGEWDLVCRALNTKRLHALMAA